MIDWNTQTNTMNLASEQPVLAFCVAVGAVLTVALLVWIEKRKE